MNNRVSEGLVSIAHVAAVISPHVADIYYDTGALVVTYKSGGERVHVCIEPGYIGKRVAVEIANRAGVDSHMMFSASAAN